ncbi:MAG: type II secretion system protein [Candidatus Polarisedimenticolia bacterium]
MRKQKGFTLIELLIVVAIIGIIAAIAIPNLLNAIDRGKQKRTMADMRSIGTAVESYAVDNNFYPRTGTTLPSGNISPIYIGTVPANDGWNNLWLYATDTNGTQYTIESITKDSTNNSDGGGQTNSFNCDIVFANGQFWQWPQGTQT